MTAQAGEDDPQGVHRREVRAERGSTSRGEAKRVQDSEALSNLRLAERVQWGAEPHTESGSVVGTQDDDGTRIRGEDGRKQLLEVAVDTLELIEKVAIAAPIDVRRKQVALRVVQVGPMG